MKRYDRSRFLAFGLLPATNVIGLLLYGLGLATHGTGGAAASLPALVGLAGICLLIAMAAAIKRGHDVGVPTWMTIVGFFLSPLLLVMLGYYAFAKSKPKGDDYGPPAEPANFGTWVWALVSLAWPWVVLAILAKVL